MADVHSLFGAKLDDQGVNQDVVEHIRGLLIEAERGDVLKHRYFTQWREDTDKQ